MPTIIISPLYTIFTHNHHLAPLHHIHPLSSRDYIRLPPLPPSQLCKSEQSYLSCITRRFGKSIKNNTSQDPSNLRSAKKVKNHSNVPEGINRKHWPNCKGFGKNSNRNCRRCHHDIFIWKLSYHVLHCRKLARLGLAAAKRSLDLIEVSTTSCCLPTFRTSGTPY